MASGRCVGRTHTNGEVTLCMDLLRALVKDDYGYCEVLVKQANCSAECKVDMLQYIADARDGNNS